MILVRYSGEIATKARMTRIQFTRRLVDNLRDALGAEGIPARVRREWNRVHIATEDPADADVVCRVFGIQSISVGEYRRWETLDDIVSAGREIFRPQVAGRRFAVRANRCGKNASLGFRSRDVEVALGAALLPGAARVDLTDPEVTAHVEVEAGQAVFFPDRRAGAGGIPIGSQGRALALVSGGFDSAVAAWMLLRRGVALDYAFCNLGGGAHEEAVLRVTKVVADRWSYGYRPRLYSVELRPFVEEMQRRVEDRYLQVVLKRVMLRVAERIARRKGLAALVTGEAVGQVSSQTLRNLAVIDEAAGLPVLRPLVGFHKEEILDRARHIGTFELSAGVPEFCALTPSRPATRAARADVEREEAKLDLDGLETAVAAATMFPLRTLELRVVERTDIAVDAIPDGAVVLDLRPVHLFRRNHFPGALHLEYGMALEAMGALDRTRTYVLYCEVGFKSAFVAAEMRKAGIDACHVRGGMKTLVKNMDRLSGRPAP
jgi:thiamine biosynthesis protein ThiI